MARVVRWFRGLRRRWQIAIGVFTLLTVVALTPPVEEDDAALSGETVATADATPTASPVSTNEPTPDTAISTPAPTSTSSPATTPSATPSPTSSPTASPTAASGTAGTQAVVTGIVDGDTIDVRLDGSVQRVRLILIDTPEVHGGVECFGREASARITDLIPPGSPVLLERDVSETDRFGRLLRYVWLPDGRMVNEVMVEEGYAALATYPPDVKHEQRIRAAQTAARDAARGLWSACGSQATPAPVPTQAAAPAQTAVPTVQPGNCDPSYPDVCIPPYPPDLNCGDIPFRRFRVLPPDPHRFDGNNDGVGCES